MWFSSPAGVQMCSQKRAPAGYTWQYATIAPDGQVAVLQSFLDLQLAVDAHFAVGSLLWSLGPLLLASAAWSARLFSPWLAGLVALNSVCNLAGDILGMAGAPVPLALFILPLIRSPPACSASRLHAGDTERPLPRRAGIISRPTQEPCR